MQEKPGCSQLGRAVDRSILEEDRKLPADLLWQDAYTPFVFQFARTNADCVVRGFITFSKNWLIH